MAKQKPQSSLAFRLARGDESALNTVKAKKPVKKPAKKADGVSFSSNLVFDPTGQFSDILSDEQKARRDLYLLTAGRDLEQEAEKDVALEKAGLLKPGVTPADRKKLSKGGSREFASAMDALDAIGGKVAEGTGRALGGVVFGEPGAGGALGAMSPISIARNPLVQDLVKSPLGLGPAKVVAENAAPVVAKAPSGIPGVTIGEYVEGVGKGTGAVIKAAAEGGAKSFSNIPLSVGALRPKATSTGQMYTPTVKQRETLGGRAEVFERIAARPNDYIDTVRKKPIRIADENEGTAAIVDAAKAGRTSVDLDQMIAGDNPFSPMAELSLKGMATQNGWDAAEWGKLTIGEKTFRAVNENDYWGLWGRSVLRQIGETGAAPAGIKAIVGASADLLGGDTAEAERVFEAAVSPYVASNETYKKRGFWVAAQEFFRDQPVDAALLFNAAVKGASAGAGAVARANLIPGSRGARLARWSERGRPVTVKGETASQVPVAPEAIPLPGRPVSAGPGLGRQRAFVEESIRAEQARAATQAENDAARRVFEEQQRAYEETGQMVDVTPDVVVGRAGRGLLGTAVTEFVKAPAARRIVRYRKMLEKRDAARKQRFDTNVAQGEGIELRATITRLLGEGASEVTKDRAAFNLVFPARDFDGTPITPEYVARFYEAELKDLNDALEARKAEKRGTPTADELAKQKRLESAILRMRQLEEVQIDPEVMSRLRQGVKPIADVVEEHMAKAMKLSPEEARRANYVRLAAMDRMTGDRLEESAKALRDERNAPVPQLVATQRRLKTQAATIVAMASESGWGKSGPKKSREKFERAYNRMLIDLEIGERLARENGNDELVGVFRAAKEELANARMRASNALGARKDVVARIISLSLSPDEVGRLSPNARMQYEAAQRAAARAADERATEAGALERAGLKKTDVGKVAYAEGRVVSARADLAAHLALPIPDQKTVARLQAKVDKAEKELADRSVALSAGLRARKAEKQRDKRLRRVVLATGRQVLDTSEVRVALDVSERFAVMEIKKRKDLSFTIDRARLETLDAFIARQVAADENPLLHLVQSQDYENVGRALVIESDSALSRAPTAFIKSGRFKETEGFTFVNALESADLWKNLLRDTVEVRTAQVLQQRLNKLVQATSIRYRFTPQSLERAARLVKDDAGLSAEAEIDPNLALRKALKVVLSEPGVAGRVDLTDISDWVVLNIDDPKARKISGRVSYGATRKADPNADLGAFVMRTIDERSIDPKKPGDYYLMPRSVYDGIQKAIRDESFRFKQKTVLGEADRITRLWRTITLNVLPRTAINNTIGSTILAIQAGAGPRAFYYAAMAIAGRPVRIGGEKRLLPVPLELRQRYYEQLTDPLADAKGAFAPIAHWMNAMRYVNGMSEDFGRLAVWYHRAYPEAMRSEQGVRFLRSARRLDDRGAAMLDAMSRRDPNYELLMDEFVQQSFDFLGDLHKGGPVAATVRIAVPFWQWYMHMLKLTFVTMPFKYPKRALFIQMLGEIGRDYQERMGVTVPYGESFVPFFADFVETPGGTQQIVGGVNLGNWWPGATVSPIGGFENESGAFGFAQGSVNPYWSNLTLLGVSFASILAGGEAKELSDRDFFVAAKDEYGLPIESIMSPQFGAYVANHFFRMVPLSPTMMSLGGRASNAFPAPGMMEPKAYSTQQLPEEYRQAQRADVASVVDELSGDSDSLASQSLWRSNVFNFIAKAVLGSPLNYMPGHGPMARERILNDYMFAVQDMDKTRDTMLRIILERHGYEMPEGKNR